jgi:hypothetical protein
MTEESKSIPEEFNKVIKDFVNDLKTTFPEYSNFISTWWIIEDVESNVVSESSIKILFEFCQKKFPPRFFDILYQNEEIFLQDSDVDTEFLPNIHFKNLWQCDITTKTRDTIWKYLQLIMFSIVSTIHNKDAFGDTAKMFEAINETEFKTKLEETLAQMQGLFDFSGNFAENNENTESSENLGSGFEMPDANQLHEHITGMLGGKLGQLAREIAEETAENLNIEFDDATDMKDIFQQLIKNPTKLMGLVKTVGDKLDSKIKSGDLKESELMTEATEMMNKMKNMPGMGNIQSMLGKMGLGGLGGKVNTGAMEANLNQKMKMAKTKERIRAKAEANAKLKLEQQILEQQQQQQKPSISEEELIKMFSTGDKVERTPRGAKPLNKKKKGKNK